MYYCLFDDYKGSISILEIEDVFDYFVLALRYREVFSFITDDFDDCLDYFFDKRNSLKGVEQNENESNRT